MNRLIVRFVVVFLCLAGVTHIEKADAQIPVSGGQAAGIFGALIGAGVGVGVGVYFLVRAPRNITGCVSDAGANLELTDDKAMNHYLLSGEIAALKPGERVRLTGKPGRDKTGQRSFSVKKLSRSYGPCKVASALP